MSYRGQISDTTQKNQQQNNALEQSSLLSSFVEYLYALFRVEILHCHAHFVKGLYHQKMKSFVKMLINKKAKVNYSRLRH